MAPNRATDVIGERSAHHNHVPFPWPVNPSRKREFDVPCLAGASDECQVARQVVVAGALQLGEEIEQIRQDLRSLDNRHVHRGSRLARRSCPGWAIITRLPVSAMACVTLVMPMSAARICARCSSGGNPTSPSFASLPMPRSASNLSTPTASSAGCCQQKADRG